MKKHMSSTRPTRVGSPFCIGYGTVHSSRSLDGADRPPRAVPTRSSHPRLAAGGNSGGQATLEDLLTAVADIECGDHRHAARHAFRLAARAPLATGATSPREAPVTRSAPSIDSSTSRGQRAGSVHVRFQGLVLHAPRLP